MQDKYKLTLEQNIFFAKRNLVDNIYANAKMEEINITLEQIKTILDGVSVSNLRIDEIECILNLRDAWKYIITYIEDEFNLEYICKINSLVARNESLKWGVLRTGKVEITGTKYIPSIPKKDKVLEEIRNILKIKNTTEKAIEYMLYGMRNQLFWDGNKRTSTICANKIMIQNGAGIIKVSEENLEEFNTLLKEFYDTNEKEKIKSFIYEKCIDGISF